MKKRLLSEFAELIMGQSPKGDSYNKDGKGILLLNGAADFDIKEIKPTQYTSQPTKICKKGDILLCIRATIGNATVADKEYCLGRGVCAVRVIDKEVEPQYILYLLEEKVIELASRAEGSTIKGVRKEDMANLSFGIPSLETQRQIIAILERAECLKEMRLQANEETGSVVHSIFYEMFGDPIENQKNWAIKSVGEVCNVKSGGTPSKRVKEYWDKGTVPWMGSTVCKDCVVTQAKDFITENGLKNSAAKWLELDTVLIALVGATIGKTALLKIKATTNQNIAGLYPKDIRTLNPTYLFYAAQQLYPKFKALSHDSFKMANLSFIRSLEIAIPPIELQAQFASRVEHIDEIREEQNNSTQDIHLLSEALMQKAFKGELVS